MIKIDHIFFDLDHTLWDFESNSLEALSELYDEFELADVSKGLDRQYFIDRYVFHNERMWSMYRENRMSKSRLRSARFEAALRDMRIENKRLAKSIGKRYLEISPYKTKLHEGALDVVQALSKIYPMSIVSNGFQETQLIKVQESGLKPYFEHIITSERANAKKPDTRIFSFANQLTNSSKEGSLMIGDNLEIDVRGAQNSGWNAIHFNPKSLESNHQTINHLSQLVSLLSKGR